MPLSKSSANGEWVAISQLTLGEGRGWGKGVKGKAGDAVIGGSDQ